VTIANDQRKIRTTGKRRPSSVADFLCEKGSPVPKPSRDQKRKKKLEERRRRAHEHRALVDDGDEYKTDELAPVWQCTETDVYQAYVMTDRQLTDGVVFDALKTLIGRLRAGTLSWEPDADRIVCETGREQDLAIEVIRRNLIFRFTGEKPPRADLIGALGSMSGTIRQKRSRVPNSHTYRRCVAEFLVNKADLNAQMVEAETQDESPGEFELP
jgi:hypothetical protein